MGAITTARRGPLLALLCALVAGAGIAAPAPAEADTRFEGVVGSASVNRILGADRIQTAVEISRQSFENATTVVLARADTFADALAGAPLAAANEAPILLIPSDTVPPSVRTEIDRLGAEDIILLGGAGAISPDVEQSLAADFTTTRVGAADRFATAAAVARQLPASEHVYLATGLDFADALAVGPLAAAAGDPVLLVLGDTIPPAVAAVLTARNVTSATILGGPRAVGAALETTLTDRDLEVERIAGKNRFETAALIFDAGLADGGSASELWLATATDFPDALAAGPAVAAAGASLLLVSGDDLERATVTVQRLRTHVSAVSNITVLGGPGAVSDNVLDDLRGAMLRPLLPTGGRTLFPDNMMIAYYGNPQSSALGVLGEGTPAEAAVRLQEAAAPYATVQRDVLPTMEIISTVATAGPGPDGDYSAPAPIAEIQRYIDVARANDMYVLLDLQPGRSDFLTQAKLFESLLRQPDVGLALDPEWRMRPNQVPGKVIGSVDAAEINEVSAWLSQISRSELLPEKLLMLHQFRTSMITNRDQVIHRPGLATMVHVDGFGGRGIKLQTWNALNKGGFYNGFKLFYDEDTNIFDPATILGLEPQIDYISYQ